MMESALNLFLHGKLLQLHLPEHLSLFVAAFKLSQLVPRHSDLELTALQKTCTQLLQYSLVLPGPCHMPEV